MLVPIAPEADLMLKISGFRGVSPGRLATANATEFPTGSSNIDDIRIIPAAFYVGRDADYLIISI